MLKNIQPLFMAILFIVVGLGITPAYPAAETRMENIHPGDPLPVLNERATVEDFINYAILNHPGLQAAYQRWLAATEKPAQVSALPEPMLEYSWRAWDGGTPPGGERQRLGVTQMIPGPGKLRLEGAMARESALIEQSRFEMERLNLVLQVARAWFDFYYLTRSISITEENLELLKYVESVAQTRYRVGENLQEAIIKIQLEMGKMENELRSMKDMRKPLTVRLNAALNRPPDTPIPEPASLPEWELPGTEDQLLEWLVENHPEITLMDTMISREEIAVDLARRQRYPDFNLGVEYMDMKSMPMERMGDAVEFMFGMTLPLSQKKYQAAERQAKAERESVSYERENKLNELIAELQMALYNFRDAERRLALYRDTLVPLAQQSFNVALQSYTAGRSEILDVVDAERMLLEFRLAQERARVDRAQNLAEVLWCCLGYPITWD